MSKYSYKCQSGVSKLVLVVFLPLIGAVFYSAMKIIPFYYDYYELTNQMKSLARVANFNTGKELRQKLNSHLKRTGLPIGIDEIQIERFGDLMRMSTRYQEVFYITWQGKDHVIHTFNFEIKVEERF